MRHGVILTVIMATILGSVASAEAQLGRRLGNRLRDPNPPAPADAPRSEGQFRQRVQNLGERLIESGALQGAIDGLSGQPIDQLPNVSPAAALVPHALEPHRLAGPQPFTAAWYAAHPRAWRFPQPDVDAWSIVSIGTLAAWLDIAAPAPTLSPTGENVFTEPSVAPAVAASIQGDYLPLGVFAIGPPGAQRGSAYLQLAVTRDGEVRGNYFDLVTGEAQPLKGRVNKDTHLATLRLESPSAAEFEVSLVSLTRPEGNLRLRFEAGQTQDWSLARFEPEGTES